MLSNAARVFNPNPLGMGLECSRVCKNAFISKTAHGKNLKKLYGSLDLSTVQFILYSGSVPAPASSQLPWYPASPNPASYQLQVQLQKVRTVLTGCLNNIKSVWKSHGGLVRPIQNYSLNVQCH